MIELNTKNDLIRSLKESNERVTEWFNEITANDFFTRQGEVWSASDNLDHLIKSHRPIAQALKLPKITLRALFGKPHRASISYEELCQSYLQSQENPDPNAEAKKRELLNHFSKASTELVSVAEKWSEEEVNDYLLPHPILGKLTIREMLFFTIYHNLRHASREGD